MRAMQPPFDWLLAGEPWIEYRTRLDLLGQSEHAPEVRAARRAMLAHPKVRGLVAELAGWPGKVIASHKSSSQPFHKLTFLADLGLTAGDPGVRPITDAIRRHVSAEGPFQLPLPSGATNHDGWGWALCDAPLSVYALASFGLSQEPHVARALHYLAGLVRANGWPCAVSLPVGHFRGPGRQTEPCPYATLAMLKALSAAPDWAASAPCHTGAEALLSLWPNSYTQHPYQFYMGRDFRKLKVPFVWYDLLHVLEVLSRFDWLREDPRLLDMLTVLEKKADADCRFTSESVWAAWKDWEFGQKQAPSRWLTLLAWRTIRRFEMVEEPCARLGRP